MRTLLDCIPHRYWSPFIGKTYCWNTRGSFPGGKATGAWSWPLSSI